MKLAQIWWAEHFTWIPDERLLQKIFFGNPGLPEETFQGYPKSFPSPWVLGRDNITEQSGATLSEMEQMITKQRESAKYQHPKNTIRQNFLAQ